MNSVNETFITSCPSNEVLRRWAQGTLPEDQADDVTDHLDDCETCDLIASEADGLKEISQSRSVDPFLQEDQCKQLSGLMDVNKVSEPAESHSRYELRGEIARGGMGAVLRGYDKNLGRDLAIKVLLDEHNDDPEVIRRFIEEAQIGGQLQHPGIAPVYELGKFSDNRRFFAMKLVNGQTLAQLLRDRKDFTSDRSRFIGIFEQICQTIAYAHSRRVIHRDLKPANIMVGAFGEVQVMDWGLARVLTGERSDKQPTSESPVEDVASIVKLRKKRDVDADDEQSVVSSKTQIGSVMGTLAYMSPEQARGETDQVNELADVFGLGAILCKILTGYPPYIADQKSVRHLMASQGNLQDCYARLDECGADKQLILLTKQCLEPRRDARLSSAGLLAERVTGYLETVETKLREAEVEQAAQAARADSERHRYRTSLALAASVVLLLGLAGGGWLYTERQESNRLMAEAERQHAKELEAERSSAIAAKESAELAEKKGRQLLYVTDMQLAPLLWKNADATLNQLRDRLNRHDPEKNSDLKDREDLRGFEWHYYQNLVNNTSAFKVDHTAEVVDAKFTTDGRLQTVTRNGQLNRFNLLAEPDGQAKPLQLPEGNASRLSPGGQFAARFENQSLEFFDTQTGEMVWTLATTGKQQCLHFSENGKWLVVIDNRLRWIETATGREMAGTNLNPSTCFGLGVSADGQTAAVAVRRRSKDSVSVFRLDEEEGSVSSVKENIESYFVRFSRIGLSPDGRMIIVSSNFRGAFCIYDSATGDLINSCNAAHVGFITATGFSSDGKLVATAATSGMINVWSTTDKIRPSMTVATLKGHRSRVLRLQFSPDVSRLVSVSNDKTARVWDLVSPNPAFHLLADSPSPDNEVRYSTDGRIVAAVLSKYVETWDTQTGQPIRKLLATDGAKPTAIAFSPAENSLLAVGYVASDRRAHVVLWDSNAGKEVARLPGTFQRPDTQEEVTMGKPSALAFSPDGKLLVGCSGYGNRLRVWDIKTREVVQLLEEHKEGCTALDFSPDGKWLASAGSDGSTIVWSTATWKSEHILSQRQDSKANYDVAVTDVKFSPDATTLATSDINGIIRLWSVGSGEHLEKLDGRSGPVQAVGFSPDGRTLASCCTDQSVHLWNMATCRKLMKLTGRDAQYGLVGSLEFSPDGRQLAVGGDQKAFWSVVPRVEQTP